MCNDYAHHLYLHALTFPMSIAYTFKQFYNRHVYIVVSMYEIAFDQKYICNDTSSVILPYPLQYIKIVEIDCRQIKITNIYVPSIYA